MKLKLWRKGPDDYGLELEMADKVWGNFSCEQYQSFCHMLAENLHVLSSGHEVSTKDIEHQVDELLAPYSGLLAPYSFDS